MRADKQKVSALLKTAKGQIDGILKMIEDDRYCIDISNQLLAVTAILKKANAEVLSSHIEGCVKNAVENGDLDDKLEEISELIKKISK